MACGPPPVPKAGRLTGSIFGLRHRWTQVQIPLVGPRSTILGSLLAGRLVPRANTALHPCLTGKTVRRGGQREGPLKPPGLPA